MPILSTEKKKETTVTTSEDPKELSQCRDLCINENRLGAPQQKGGTKENGEVQGI